MDETPRVRDGATPCARRLSLFRGVVVLVTGTSVFEREPPAIRAKGESPRVGLVGVLEDLEQGITDTW
jgi:hypothetical protein